MQLCADHKQVFFLVWSRQKPCSHHQRHCRCMLPVVKVISSWSYNWLLVTFINWMLFYCWNPLLNFFSLQIHFLWGKNCIYSLWFLHVFNDLYFHSCFHSFHSIPFYHYYSVCMWVFSFSGRGHRVSAPVRAWWFVS